MRFITIYAVFDPWSDDHEPILLTRDWAHAARRRDRINVVRLLRRYDAPRAVVMAGPGLSHGDRCYVEEWQVD